MRDPFLIAMVALIAAAFAAPDLGARDGPLHISLITQIGIALVFFLHGASLSREALKLGATSWRVHILVQSATFVIFPIVGLGLYFAAAPFAPEELRLGLFFLCALPSTISSSVALIALAKGDVAAGVFNASLSGLLGMVLTPLLMGLVAISGEGVPIASAIRDIALKLFLPFAVGHLLRPWIAGFLAPHKKLLSTLDRSVILLIVYGAFCESVAAGMWSRYGVGMLLTVLAGAAVLLAAALFFTQQVARRIGLSKEQEIASMFCGSQKSLASGAPMAKILFGAHPALAMIMLPILFYHQLQLVVCTGLAKRFAARSANVT